VALAENNGIALNRQSLKDQILLLGGHHLKKNQVLLVSVVLENELDHHSVRMCWVRKLPLKELPFKQNSIGW
jgi:hypothetical protein